MKSLVWYVPENFEDAGYEVPTTMEELKALTEQIVADGGTPWCIGLGSGGATGWPATDWVEDLMLRTQPPEVYDQWVTNEIPFTDPRIVAAIDEFGWFAKNDKFVDGGAAAVASTDFRDSPKGLFASPPKCYMHHQASFIPSFFPEGTKLGADADFFYMPPYADKPDLGKPVLGAGTLVLITKDTPAARAFIEFLKTPIAHEIWMAQSSFLTPFKGVNIDAYANDQMKRPGRDPAQLHHLPLRRLGPDARQDRRRRLLDRHGRLRRRQGRRDRRRPRSRRSGTRSSKPRLPTAQILARTASRSGSWQNPANGC